MTDERQRIEEELAAALEIEDEYARVESLIHLAPALSEGHLDELLARLSNVQDEALRAEGLGRLAPYLNERQIQNAELAAMNIGSNLARMKALGALAPDMTPERFERVISYIQSEPSPQVRLKAWLGMPHLLSAALKQESISTALGLTDDWERANALIALAPHLTDTWKLKALNSVRKISDPITRVQGLSGLLPTLAKKEKAETLDEALTLTRELASPHAKVEALLGLLEQMPRELYDDLLREAVDIAMSGTDEQEQVRNLISIATSPAVKERKGILTRALFVATAIKDETRRGESLIMLAISSPPEFHSEILTVAQDIKDPKTRSKSLIQLLGIIDEQISSVPTPTAASDPSGLSDSGGPVAAPNFEVTDVTSGESGEASTPAGPPQTPETETDLQALLAGTDTSQTKAPRAKAARKKAAKVAAPAIQSGPAVEPTPSAPEELATVKAFLHSDRWTLDDQLGYSIYAKAVVEFICQGDTKPPLAIGILAPWGQGKTTLMNLIRQEFARKEGRQPSQDRSKPPVPPRPYTTFGQLRKWLADPDYSLFPKKLDHPTVWFNAWKYSNGEQVWAGMAYTILSELVEQIETQVEREKFWLALQAERIDFNAIRRNIHRVVLERVVPWLVLWATVALLGLLVFSFGMFAGFRNVSIGGLSAVTLSSLMALMQWLIARIRVDRSRLEGTFAQYIRQPTYENKLGFFHEVEQDVRRVFSLLVDESNPVVVFIDDLDRCSPGTVAQVIEAMNLFLSGDFPNCYFIIGMDAQVVAASMEVAYETLDRKLKSVMRSYGSLGWYFMDKFIQLQFSIPNMTPGQRSTYLARLFGQEADGKGPIANQVLDQVEQQVEEKLKSEVLKPEELSVQAAELAKLRLQRPGTWQRLSHALIETGAKQLSDDSTTIQKYLKRYEPYLGSSPRGMKRFANLYRFYSLAQLSRQLRGLPASSPSALARWLVIMLRWPQVVRWIQWEGESKLASGDGAQDKARGLENELGKRETYAAWLEYLKEIDNQMEWLHDKQLYEFLKTLERNDERLSNAVETGVW